MKICIKLSCIILMFTAALMTQNRIDTKELGRGLYRITVDGINCVALIDSGGNALISDNLKESHATDLLHELKKLGSRSIRYMINTHFHNDHCGGNKVIPCSVALAHVNTRRSLETDYISSFWRDTTRAFPDSALPALTFSERMTIHFAGEEIELRHYPSGHTDGDIVVHFRRSNVVHISDLLFSIGFPAIDFTMGGNAERFADNLKQIITHYPDESIFVAGHGGEFTKKELIRYQMMVSETTDTVKQAMLRGWSLDRIKKNRILTSWGEWSNGYFSCDDWAEILFENFKWRDTVNSFFNLSDYSGDYIDSSMPDLDPVLFAPGVITTSAYEGCSGFGENMSEFLFQRRLGDSVVLFVIQRKNGKWQKPAPLLIGDSMPVYDFTMSPDGKTFVFASSKPVNESGTRQKGHNIYYLKKTTQGWSSVPLPIEADINTEYHDGYPSLSENGNLYFFSNRSGGMGKNDLYISEFRNGQYQVPVNLGSQINSEYDEWDPYIAKDESYLIFCSNNPAGKRENDLYISFQIRDHRWSRPVSLGDKVNTRFSENRTYVTNDGKYLFFTRNVSGNRDIYWVSSKIIEELRPKE